MNHSRLFRLSSRFASVVLGVAVVTAAAPSAAEDLKVRLGWDGTKSVATFEFLQDTTMTMLPGANPTKLDGRIALRLDNVVTGTVQGGRRENTTPTPSLFFEYQFKPTDSLTQVSGPYAVVGYGSYTTTFEIATSGTFQYGLTGTFEPGGSFTFKQGVYEWDRLFTESPWSTPGDITLTTSMFGFYGENTDPLNPSDWALTGSGPPGPTPVPEIDPAGIGGAVALASGVLGLIERRRRKTA